MDGQITKSWKITVTETKKGKMFMRNMLVSTECQLFIINGNSIFFKSLLLVGA